MVTTYPSAVDNSTTLPTILDNITGISASTVNILRDTSIAIESTLGVKPQGVYTTVRARLDALEAVVGSFISLEVSFSGDISGNSVHQTVVGIQTIPVAPVAPVYGQPLIYNGVNYSPSTNFGAQNIITTGSITSGPIFSTSAETGLLTADGKFIINAISPILPSSSNQAIIYYDTTLNKLRVSENGGPYVNIIGGSDVTVTNITGNYVTNSNDDVISVGTISSPITVSLYATPVKGQSIIVKDSNASAAAHNITVSGNGNTIDGASSIVIDSNYASLTLIFNGTNWGIV